jgi:hypothetical protein
VVVPGVSAHPTGGGTIAESACREAMEKVAASLRAALPVDAVLLRLHGAMYAEGVGPAETELAGTVRQVIGPKVPIACTFDLHGNIPARLGHRQTHALAARERSQPSTMKATTWLWLLVGALTANTAVAQDADGDSVSGLPDAPGPWIWKVPLARCWPPKKAAATSANSDLESRQ